MSGLSGHDGEEEEEEGEKHVENVELHLESGSVFEDEDRKMLCSKESAVDVTEQIPKLSA